LEGSSRREKREREDHVIMTEVHCIMYKSSIMKPLKIIKTNFVGEREG
jgi:hypothetical protein